MPLQLDTPDNNGDAETESGFTSREKIGLFCGT